MHYHTETNTYIPDDAPFTLGELQYPQNWLRSATPEEKAALGLHEVIEAGTREDDRYFWVTEQLVGFVKQIVNTPKDPDMIAQMESAQAQTQIDAIEARELLPRVLRVYLLGTLSVGSYEYEKVRAVDDQVAALRAKLVPVVAYL